MMQHVKRVLTFVFVIVVAVTTRIIVRDGIRSVLDRFTNSAGAQSNEDTPKPDAPKQGTSPLSAGGPLGAGPKAAARAAAAKANAQLSEQTGQDVPKPAGTPPAASPTPAPARIVAAGPATPTPATKAPLTNTPATNAPTNAPVSKFVPQPDAKTVVQQGGPQAPPQTPPAKKDTAKAAKPTSSPADTKVAATPAAATKPGTPAATAPAPTTTAAKPNTPTSTAPATAAPVFRPTPASGDSAKSLVMRETFAYSRDARRDPFVSLMTTSDLRPTMSDLRLTGILYDLSGRRPVAILRDLAGGQWRVTTGMTLGRMRVAQIKPKTVIFTIEEFGFSRNDSLLLGDTTRVRVIR